MVQSHRDIGQSLLRWAKYALTGAASLVLAGIVYCAAAGMAYRDRGEKQALRVMSGELCQSQGCEPAVRVSGYMDVGFTTRFVRMAGDQFETAHWVCLDSPGGSPFEAIHLAQLIEQAGKKTCVVPASDSDKKVLPSRCASACAYAFAAGRQRVLADDRSLAIHRPYLGEGAPCIPCNYVVAPLMQGLFAYLVRHGMNNPAPVERTIARSERFPDQYDAKPSAAHWVEVHEFTAWELGTAEDFGHRWHFVAREH